MRLFLAMAVIAVTETAVMVALHGLFPGNSGRWWLHTAIDTFVLLLVCLPTLWWLFLRPLKFSAAQARAQVQVIMDTAGEGIITTDEHGIIQTFNRAAEIIFGYAAGEVVGQNVSCLMPDPFHAAHDGQIGDDLGGAGAKVGGRKRLVTGLRKDGSTFPLEIVVGDVRVGGRRLLTSVMHDVSDYKAAEAALSHSKELLERIFCGIHSLVAYMDRDFNFIRVNSTYAAADNQTPDFFVGKNHFALYPDAENEAIFRRVLASGEPYEAFAKPFSYAGHPERGPSYWDIRLTPIKDAKGQVGSLLLTLLDVTQRKLAEQEKLRAVARFRLLFDNANDAIFIHEPDGCFIEVNQRACERLGYSRAELLKLTPRQIDSPEFAAKIDDRIAQLRAHGAIVFESAHLRRDGAAIPVEISSRLIDYDGRQVVMSVARDITEHKRLEAALHENEENARALLDAIGESAMLLTTDGVILSINATGAQRLRQTPEGLKGVNLRQVLPPDVAESRLAHIDTAARSGRPLHFEDVRAGRLYQVSLNPIHNAAGQVRLVAAYAQDITETRRLQRIEELLRDADEHILRGTQPAELMTFVCDRVVRLFGLGLAWFGRKEPDGAITLVAGAGPETAFRDEVARIGVRWDDSPTGRSATGVAIRLGKIHLASVSGDDFAPWREAARRHGLICACAIPLVIRGEIYGAFTLYSNQPEAFHDQHLVQTLENVAARVAVALEASFEHEQLRLLSTALATASNAVFITDRNGIIQWVNDAFTRLSGYASQEIIGSTPRLLKSGAHDATYYQALWSTITSGHAWCSATTERRKDGSLYTVRQTITPVRNQSGEISHFISMHEDISEALAAQARIEHLAHFDALTGLPNRSLFFDRLNQATTLSKRTGEHVVLFFLDLDYFKPVNDTYGHAVGDALLRAVAERLMGCVRESDTVARIAGDEFTVILPRIDQRADAAVVAEKIIKEIARPFTIEGHTIRIGTSIGIALYPDDASTEPDLIRVADDAMYAAKRQSRNTYHFHSPA